MLRKIFFTFALLTAVANSNPVVAKTLATETAEAIPSLENARDINFIEPADLPKITSRSYRNHSRGELPNLPEDYGLDVALKDKSAEEYCMAPVGRQLSEWKTEKRDEHGYWFYSLSATFECLPPIPATVISYEKAKAIMDSTRGVKKAKILCYESYEEVCEGSRLLRYKSHHICEIQGLDSGQTPFQLEDIEDNSKIVQDQGARVLTRLLPVFTDGRRDDSPGSNCGGHVYRKLKGLWRKSAKVTCSSGEIDSCRVEGMVRP